MTQRAATAALMLVFATACHSSDLHRAASADSLGRIGPMPGPGVAHAGATNPYSGDRTAMVQGYQYFRSYNCAGCHGDHGGGGMGPSLRDSLWYYGASEAQIFASIYEGRDKGMPAWGTKLPPAEIWKLVTYIKSMRTINEPDAPH